MSRIANRVLSRLGHPTVEVYTEQEVIEEFIFESVEKMIPYCMSGHKKGGYFNLTSVGDCELPFNHNRIIDVYPDKPATVLDPITDQFYGLLYRDDNMFSWTYGAGKTIHCKTLRNRVWVEWYDYGEVSFDDLTPFYQNLAIRYAVALTKESEANIRGKFEFNSSPFSTNAADLRSEAESEKSSIEDILSSQPIMKAVTVTSF